MAARACENQNVLPEVIGEANNGKRLARRHHCGLSQVDRSRVHPVAGRPRTLYISDFGRPLPRHRGCKMPGLLEPNRATIMDFGSITTAVGSLKAAGELAKGLIGLKSDAEVQAKAIELNQKIIDAQHQIFAANAAQTSLLERIRDMEAEIAHMNDWGTQKQRYKLAAPFSGCMVYALQKSMSDGETPHYLCTTCFHKGQPTILQGRETHGPGRSTAVYYCPTCKSEAKTQWSNVTAPQYFEDIKQG